MPTIKNNCSIWTQDWKNVKPVYKLKKSNSSRAVNFGVNTRDVIDNTSSLIIKL